ncbi:MAG: hypothetical protein Q4D26_09805 [Clostridia bacterium]|nr:hypothetical protein [Clostridia bacterium]
MSDLGGDGNFTILFKFIAILVIWFAVKYFLTDGKGNTTEYTYNALGLVTNKKVPFALDSSGNMQYTNYSCSYDAVGNVTRDTVTSGVVNTYSYDYRNRVTQAKSGEQSVNYVYDNVGNMIQYKTANGTQVHKYAYDALNRVTK